MTITYHDKVVQGSTEWTELRCGLLTASEMKLIITPTLKIAASDKERAHLYALAAQRVAKYTEVGYEGYDMLRGREDEIDAKVAYMQHYGPVEDCGFITNDQWGFTLGYSPDGLVGGKDGLLEAKSRKHSLQMKVFFENVSPQTIPEDHVIQCQSGLLIADRTWLDYISFSAGLPMATIRTYPDPVIQNAIVEAAGAFEDRLSKRLDEFHSIITSGVRLLATDRRIEREIHL